MKTSGPSPVVLPEVLRYATFTTDPNAGNPAGVVLDAHGLTTETMQDIARDVGYSETAFAVRDILGIRVRYFSPLTEVDFCGHATIALACAYAARHGTGTVTFATNAGAIPVTTKTWDGHVTATLTSAPPRVAALTPATLTELLIALRWRPDDLDNHLPAKVAWAGNWHPILAAATPERLANLDYDSDVLTATMRAYGWTTIQLVHRTAPDEYTARNPFPIGGVFEDPATGSAAAALGGYLREQDLVRAPATITVHQGHYINQPSTIHVHIPPTGGIHVTGAAVDIPKNTSETGAEWAAS
ncbi:PhzF family phenazine biosynthesis protein [Phytomonospora endophytica]|uniref:PhzF family phenazine biosynthesis protein n=1 Tax=Phytomonospora endophytica TaxID=714109 RepID=A0A841FPG7_9ACTN|nr:PhzF family phenazine biosynthesis isomerase [Phytomonospora endophytica]MBB6037724.1 PhzF family phenazine biosynthesis protein [Phytomonospora endophytica]GIG67748.1 oxidoreductase [Phytomonospora endophytica]